MRWPALLALGLIVVASRAAAQGPGAPQASATIPVFGGGASPASFQDSSGGIIGGRPGHPRIQPGRSGARRLPPAEALPAPRPQPGASMPHMGLFAFDAPQLPEDEGPPNGLTLDQAIECLKRSSLTLRAKSLEIPQARADELTASLRANPFIFGDGQLVPYGHYSSTGNPGGPTQYDLNVTYPVDVSRKRVARMEVANQARRTVEAQYMDAVRQELDLLSMTYVDVLAARETLRFAQASLDAVNQALAMQDKKRDETLEGKLQIDHIEVHRDAVELAILDGEANLRTSKRALATILCLPREAQQQLDLRGSLRDRAAAAPPTEELIPMALAARPDLAAFRLSVCRAVADVRLAQANRFSDVFVLYQPFTYQDNVPFNLPSSTSWALGATMTAPLYDRNQGNIRRTKFNVDQSRLELQVMERRVLSEVEDARQEYEVSRQVVDRIERRLLPAARHVRDHSLQMSQRDDGDVYAYLIAQRDFQDLVRQYRDALVRHRRSMLKLNSAVGLRLMP